MGLRPRLFDRVINQHRVALIPAAALETGPLAWIRALDERIVPELGEALVALCALVVVLLRQAELVAAPDANNLPTEGLVEQLFDHAADILGFGRGPEDDPEGLNTVRDERLSVATALKIGGVLAIRTEQKGAVEIDDNEQRAGMVATLGQEGGAYQIGVCGIGDAAGLLAGSGDFLPVSVGGGRCAWGHHWPFRHCAVLLSRNGLSRDGILWCRSGESVVRG